MFKNENLVIKKIKQLYYEIGLKIASYGFLNDNQLLFTKNDIDKICNNYLDEDQKRAYDKILQGLPLKKYVVVDECTK